jgi:hypothetical protein
MLRLSCLPDPKPVLAVAPKPDVDCPNPVVAGFAPNAELPPKPVLGVDVAIVMGVQKM